jgi:hypothetical protein
MFPVRFEPVLVAFFLAIWVVVLLAVLGVVDMRGNLELGLYPLYSVASALGWIAGNMYSQRSSGLPRTLRRRVWVVYYLGPPGIVYLLRLMASPESQRAAPLVPFYAFGVFSALFLVPVLIPNAPGRRRLRADYRRDGEDDDPPVVP